MIKAIKINSCSDPMFWYRKYVGTLVPFVRDLSLEGFYLCREPDGYSNIVRITDAEIVEVESADFYKKS